jgi:hypothetical protein
MKSDFKRPKSYEEKDIENLIKTLKKMMRDSESKMGFCVTSRQFIKIAKDHKISDLPFFGKDGPPNQADMILGLVVNYADDKEIDFPDTEIVKNRVMFFSWRKLRNSLPNPLSKKG